MMEGRPKPGSGPPNLWTLALIIGIGILVLFIKYLSDIYFKYI